jgi:hypothetical protein
MSRKFRTARVLTIGYLATALALSFAHISALFLYLGAGWQSFAIPLLIDSVVVIGKLSSGADISAKGNRSARSMVLGGLAASLALNVAIGVINRSPGEILAGLIVVGGALIAERHMERHTPKAVRAPSPAAPVVKAKDPKRVEAARKAAVTRRVKAAKLDAELAIITADGR